MLRLLLLFLMLTGSFWARAQVQGKVVEAGEDQAIPFASLLVLETGLGTVADEAGYFTLPFNGLRTGGRGSTEPAERTPLLVRVSALGFRPDTLLLSPGPERITIRLERDNELPTITVRSQNERELTELKYDKYQPLYLAEWGDKVVTCYQRAGKKAYQLRMLRPTGEETVHYLDFGAIEGISSRCSERLYVLTREYAISFDLVNDELVPVERLPRNDYDWLFADCRDRTGERFLYEKQRLRGMNKVYLLASDARERVIREYLDSALVEEFVYGTPMMDFDWVETRRPAPWWSANGKGRRAQAMRHFDRYILYNNHHANPFFFAGDAIRLINFDEGLVETFTTQGEPVGKVTFSAEVDRSTRLSEQIVRDQLTGEVFAMARDRTGHRLYRFDLETGETRFLLHFGVGEVRKLVVRGGRFWLMGRRSPTGMDGGWRILRGEV